MCEMFKLLCCCYSTQNRHTLEFFNVGMKPGAIEKDFRALANSNQ